MAFDSCVLAFECLACNRVSTDCQGHFDNPAPCGVGHILQIVFRGHEAFRLLFCVCGTCCSLGFSFCDERSIETNRERDD